MHRGKKFRSLSICGAAFHLASPQERTIAEKHLTLTNTQPLQH